METAKSIIKTLAFFNLFEHPLTNWELHQRLYTAAPVSLEKVLREARNCPLAAVENGFFCLAASRQAARKRQERAVWNDYKMSLARRAARLISWIPFVRLAAVCNTLSFGAAEEESDIDFFIIAKKGRIWTVRLFITIVLSLFGLRRHGRHITNRVCLSFFITDDNLDLQPVALPVLSPPCEGGGSACPPLTKGGIKGGLPDIYLIYWITHLIPLINRDQTLEKFWQANGWVKNYLANFSFESQLPDYHQISIPGWIESWRCFHERIMGGQLGDWRERIFKRLQLKKMSAKESKRPAGDIGVVINDQMLKFHEEDRRKEYRRRWEEKCLGILKIFENI